MLAGFSSTFDPDETEHVHTASHVCLSVHVSVYMACVYIYIHERERGRQTET